MQQQNLPEISQSILIETLEQPQDKQIHKITCFEMGRYLRKESCGHSYEARKYRSYRPQQLGQTFLIKKIQYRQQEPALNELIYHNEVRILSYLRNSKVIFKKITHCKQNKQFFVVLEKDQFGTLAEFSEYLKGKSLTLTNEEILFLLKEILQACHSIHQQNVIHRNLKLENIAFAEDFTAKLTDFSLAKIGKDQIFTKMNKCGTLNYLAPEIMHGDDVKEWGEKSQVWSIGAIIYNLIYGQFPVNVKTLQKQHLKIDLPKSKMMSKQLLHLLSRMLEIEPSKRITIKELLSSKLLHSKEDIPSIKSKMMQKYNVYFDQVKKQRSTWKRNIDYCKLQVHKNIIGAIEKPQKVIITKLIKDKRFGFFILLSNLKLIAYFNNGIIMSFQTRFLINVISNFQKILLWMYKQHFEKEIKSKMEQEKNIIYEEVECSVKKLIVTKGREVFIRLTNQVIQVFFPRKEGSQFSSQYSTNVCMNYHKQNPNTIKITNTKVSLFQSLQQGILQNSKHCQYIKNILQILIDSSLTYPQ